MFTNTLDTKSNLCMGEAALYVYLQGISTGTGKQYCMTAGHLLSANVEQVIRRNTIY